MAQEVHPRNTVFQEVSEQLAEGKHPVPLIYRNTFHELIILADPQPRFTHQVIIAALSTDPDQRRTVRELEPSMAAKFALITRAIGDIMFRRVIDPPSYGIGCVDDYHAQAGAHRILFPTTRHKTSFYNRPVKQTTPETLAQTQRLLELTAVESRHLDGQLNAIDRIADQLDHPAFTDSEPGDRAGTLTPPRNLIQDIVLIPREHTPRVQQRLELERLS